MSFVFPAWPLAASWCLLPPSLCVSRFSFVLLGPLFFLFSARRRFSPPAPPPPGACVVPCAIPWKIACLERLDKPRTVSELRAFLRSANSYQEFVRLYAHHAAPLYSMLQLLKSEASKGSNHPLHWTPEPDSAFEDLKRELLKALALFLVNPDKRFVIRTDASDYAMGAVLE